MVNISEHKDFNICPVCFKDRPFELEQDNDPDKKHLFSCDSDFRGVGKDQTIQDAWEFEEDGHPKFWIHLFPICPVCCGTGIVLDTDEFVALQAEVAMVVDNLLQIIKAYEHHPSILREHTDRITLVLVPMIVRRILHLVPRPARHSYARYLGNLFNLM
ncbi:hypothetical protein KKF34_17230 [Myxococcota bacterium]|nr:hypothetical protein [Myxococcota bacterium]MBU1382338.1 hypothetical protein [Myxococcota bacterium]MBU1498624.1 hypothetical protein [Myxococcota bacterium]